MAVKDDEKDTEKWNSILALVFITIAAGVATYFLMPIFLPADQKDVQIITAVEGPIKVKLDDVGGTAIKNQDSAVMSMIGNNAKNERGVENLRPPSSDPELPPVKLAEKSSEVVTSLGNDNQTMSTPAKTATNIKMAKDDDISVSKIGNNTKGKQTAKVATLLVPSNKQKTEKPVNNKANKALKTDGPLYRVQLAAFRKAEKASEIASLLMAKHRTRLKDIALETTKIETNDNGLFWRVVTEPVVRVDADSLCTLLKRAGQDCILRKMKAAGE